jgi:D-serine deaminase-like pyridoxal phosphate-dependent protein
LSFDSIDTPAVVIDCDIVERNILAFQNYCDRNALELRPHIKTHKLIEFAQFQVSAGAVGINCQKIGEAEVMAAGGIDDILITYNIVGELKLNRLLALSQKLKKLSVSADSMFTVNGLSETFASASNPLEVLVECDTGAGRCGVQSPADAIDLATHIDSMSGLKFGGLMTYPATGGTMNVQEFMSEAKRGIEATGLSCNSVTSGGTPDMWSAAKAPVVTEYRVGTYIYNDRSLVESGVCGWKDCALHILASVVSMPSPGHAIIDAGSKSLTSDLLGLDGYGYIVDYPDIRISGLSEEHGHLEFPVDHPPLRVGQRLRVIPNHACVVSNLVDDVVFVRGGDVEKKVKVDARGQVA